MKSLEQIRSDNWYAQLQANLKAELGAAQEFYEATGEVFQDLHPVVQRKLIEHWKEDHQ